MSSSNPKSIRIRFAFKPKKARPLPFTVEGKTLRFFTGAPGVVRVLTGDRELVYSLTLPQPGDTVWKPSNVKIGAAGRAPLGPASRDLWQWLALAGAAGLLADWILYGRIDRRLRAAKGACTRAHGGKRHDLRASLGADLPAPAAGLDVLRVAAHAACQPRWS